jgi:hypothetical protein
VIRKDPLGELYSGTWFGNRNGTFHSVQVKEKSHKITCSIADSGRIIVPRNIVNIYSIYFLRLILFKPNHSM